MPITTLEMAEELAFRTEGSISPALAHHIERKKARRIIAAAVRLKGLTITYKPATPHSDLIVHMERMGFDINRAEYGFIDTTGNFYTRLEARVITNSTGQCKKATRALYTEDLGWN